MVYFSKIEAYLADEMTDLEKSIFEQELAENLVLKQEFEAYQTAESLFNFSAEHLSTTEIIADSAAIETAEDLIQFTANHLTEAEILATAITSKKQEATIRSLPKKSNRKQLTWLVAASFLLLVGSIGMRVYNNQASWEQLGKDVVVNKSPENITPPTTESEITPENTVAEIDFSTKTEEQPAVLKEKTTVVQQKNISKPIVKNPPSQKKYNTRNPVVQHLASTSIPKLKKPTISAVKTIKAKEIASGTFVDAGQTLEYQAEEGITLKPGFHAKSGANFIAASTSPKETIVSNAKVATSDKVTLAAKDIVLKPGFHAIAGTHFIAKTGREEIANLSTETTIARAETVIFKATHSITFGPGFHAKSGSEIIATVN